jgi:hypothetical protein
LGEERGWEMKGDLYGRNFFILFSVIQVQKIFNKLPVLPIYRIRPTSMIFFNPYIEIFLQEIETLREKHKIIDVPFLPY